MRYDGYTSPSFCSAPDVQGAGWWIMGHPSHPTSAVSPHRRQEHVVWHMWLSVCVSVFAQGWRTICMHILLRGWHHLTSVLSLCSGLQLLPYETGTCVMEAFVLQDIWGKHSCVGDYMKEPKCNLHFYREMISCEYVIIFNGLSLIFFSVLQLMIMFRVFGVALSLGFGSHWGIVSLPVAVLEHSSVFAVPVRCIISLAWLI